MGKYKIGDTVDVRDDLVNGEICMNSMYIDAMRGRSLKIAEVNVCGNKNWYKVFLQNSNIICSWIYSEEMFEDAATPRVTIELRRCQKLDVIYMRAGSMTICLPARVPMGIAIKHPKDEEHTEIGEALAYQRMVLATFEEEYKRNNEI